MVSWATTKCHYMSRSSPVNPDNTFRSHEPDINIPTNAPFHQFIFDKCDLYKDDPAVEDFLTGRKYTHSQVKEKSIKVASALHRLGYRKGDVITSFSTNHVDFTILMLACAANGIWFSPANPTYTHEELSRQLNCSGSKAVFTIAPVAGTVKTALDNKDFPNKVKKLFVFGEAPGFQPFQTLLDDDGKAFPDVDINPVEDVLTLPYSSGTTGLPKGVMLTHYNCLANCIQTQSVSKTTGSDRCLGLLPLYHIYGMITVQFSCLYAGASVIYLPKFDPESFLRCLQDRKITLAYLVPPLIVFLAKQPMVDKFNLKSLETVFSGAAPLGEDLSVAFLKRLNHGVSLNQGFGLTETSPLTNLDYTRKPGSIGPMITNTLGKFVDLKTKKVLGPGEFGEFCVKGPQVMKGYFNNKQATDEMVTPDGWLHTGDAGHFTKDGFVYIRDRIKELIKYKGSQVAPAELEALLLGHSDIQDVAVIGVPDEMAGELPKAFVVKKPSAKVTEQEIIKFVEGKVSPIKKLRGGVELIDEIPKTPSGKILRRVLKAKYLPK
ncbi:unnamed protein product [Lymnaea stagnalis]|uniref:Uncharacterized protein n=1 Tax=Lymnaea stagnalis TaxID=6523 RepID=A0AAV2HIM4_LYMST